MIDLGTVKPGSTIRIPFSTYKGSDGAAITMTNYATADILIYKDGSTTERASTSGFTATTDFDSKTGKQLLVIDLADNTTADFYASGSEYLVAIDSVTIDTATTGGWVARFKIGYQGAYHDTTIASLASQTSFTLTAGSADNSGIMPGSVCIVHKANSAVQIAVGVVSAYTGSTKTVTLAADPAVYTMAAKDNVSFFFPANAKWIGHTSQTGRDIGASVLLSSGTGTGQVLLSSGKVSVPDTQKVDVETIKTRSVTCAAGVTVLASVGTAAASTAQTGDTYALANGSSGFVATKADTAAILVDTNELQADWTNGGRLDLIVDAILVDTGTTLQAELDGIQADAEDIQARLPAALTADGNIKADALRVGGTLQTAGDIPSLVTTVDTVVDAIKTKTDQFVFTVANQVDANALSGGGGLDAAGVRSAVGLASANLDTQFADLPTVSEFNARTIPSADYFDPATDAVANVTLVATTTNLTNLPAITSNWLTAAGIAASALNGKGDWNVGKTGYSLTATTGLGNQTANITGNLSGSVGSVTGNVATLAGAATVVLTDASLTTAKLGTFALAKTTNITGFNDITAAQVEAAILDEGDATALLAAIAAKVEEFLVNEGDATATIAAIATACNAAIAAGTVGTNVTAIKAKTDNLPTSPASTTNVTDAQTAIIAQVDANEVKIDNIQTSVNTIDGIIDNILIDTNELQTDWTNGGRLDNILDTLSLESSLLSISGVVNNILTDTNELQSDWVNGGRLDNLLDSASSAGDPWNTNLPGAYGAGTAGNIVGNNLDAAVSTVGGDDSSTIYSYFTSGSNEDAFKADVSLLATQTSVNTIDGIVDSILIDTNELQTDDIPGLISGLNNIAATDIVSAGPITTLSGAVVNVNLVDITTTNTDMRGTDNANTVVPDNSSITAIKTKTDNLPSDPASSTNITSSQTDIITQIDANEVKIDNLQTSVNTIDGIVDSILIDTNELQTDWTDGGRLDSIIDSILLDTGTDGIVISSTTANQIADAILTRDWTLVSGEAARSALNALRILRNKVSESGGTLTITEEDDSTTAWTASVTTDVSANPIITIDPS